LLLVDEAASPSVYLPSLASKVEEINIASKPQVKVPTNAAAGEIITIKTHFNHRMETGLRRDKEDNLIPRLIINNFLCEFEGEEVFSCDIDPAISADPYFKFTARVAKSGTFRFVWTDDEGSVIETEKSIEVS